MRNTQQQAQEATLVTATTLTTIATTLSTSSESKINPMWILCDNESTVDIFNNKDILTNIRLAE